MFRCLLMSSYYFLKIIILYVSTPFLFFEIPLLDIIFGRFPFG